MSLTQNVKADEVIFSPSVEKSLSQPFNRKSLIGLKKILKERRKNYLLKGILEEERERSTYEFKLLIALGQIDIEQLKTKSDCETLKISLKYLEDPQSASKECEEEVHLRMLQWIRPYCERLKN